jgi:MFS transporter, BCD family, chlorophyll transporter
MFDYKRFALSRLSAMSPQWLPFADVASDEVPLGRLLRLSLFQVTVGMALVLMVGTLNRVMIVELQVPATLVAVMLALPLVFAPFRALIGFKSDTFRSALGLRRLPFIFKGTMYQFGGFAIMPFALLVLSGHGEAVDAPRWIGLSAAALAFLLVGAGMHIVQTVGLALATDLVPEEDQPKVVGLMYVMLLVGMIVSAFLYGALLDNYSPGRLVQVIQGTAVVTIVLNGIAMWKQEARNRARAQSPQPVTTFAQAWAKLAARPGMLRLLVVIALGTAGFGMADVLLEPFGGQVLEMSVAQTTRLTVVLAFGSLAGLWPCLALAGSRGCADGSCGDGGCGRGAGVSSGAGLGRCPVGAAASGRDTCGGLRRGAVRPWDTDRHDAQRAARPDRPVAGRLGGGADDCSRRGDCDRRRDPRRDASGAGRGHGQRWPLCSGLRA